MIMMMKVSMASLLAFIVALLVGGFCTEVHGKLWEDAVSLSEDDLNSGKKID